MALWDIKSPRAAEHGFEVVKPVEVLDDFDGPLTFTFHDQRGALLLANLCAVGVDASRYLVCKVNDVTVSDLKNGLVSLRSALIRSPLWLIDVRPDGQVANVWNTSVDDLPTEAIPEPDALLTAGLEAEQFADERLASFARSGSDAQVVFDGGPVENHQIDAGFFGKFMQFTSDLLSDIYKATGATPRILRLGMTSKSSYAIDLKVAGQLDDPFATIFGAAENPDDASSRRAFDLMMSLVVDQQLAPEILTLVKLSYPLRQRYGKVLELLSNSSASVAVRTRTNPRPRKLSSTQASERLRAISELGYPFRYLGVRGKLIGGLIEKLENTQPNFVIRVEMGEEPDDFKGTVSPHAAQQLRGMKLGDEVLAELQILEDGKDQRYTLTKIQAVNDGSRHSVK